MEWLRKLLESAKIEEGKLDIEALMTSINAEFPKNAVPKATYNDISEQLKTANKTITDLKKNNTDNEELQKTIKEHETTIETMKADADKTKKEYTLKDKLRDLGVKDAEYLIFKHGGIDKFNYDKDGNLIGLEDAIKPYKESIPHIFSSGKVETHYNPAGGESASTGDLATLMRSKDFNLTEYLKNQNKQ